MSSWEVRYRKKGTKTWHHDRECAPKKYWRPGGSVMQKKCHHRTFKDRNDAVKRKEQLQSKLGSDYEFVFRRWASDPHLRGLEEARKSKLYKMSKEELIRKILRE